MWLAWQRDGDVRLGKVGGIVDMKGAVPGGGDEEGWRLG